MTVNGGGRPPDEQLYAEMGRLLEELTDGPCTEAKEQIVGFALLEVRSGDEARPIPVPG
jgi:hypothetical protein